VQARAYSVAQLRAKCTELRRGLSVPGDALASDDEIRAAWPGGDRNPYRGLDGWIECYALLSALGARQELQATRAEEASGALERTVRNAASRQPVTVSLSIGDRTVYPKSAWALAFLDSLDATMAPLAVVFSEIAEDEGGHEALRGLPSLAKGLAWRTWAWVLLSDDVGLPFPDEGVIEPPTWTEQLRPEDFLVIWKAHREIHYEASLIMSLAMPSEPGERSRLSLGGFLAGYGSEHGIAPSVLVRRWSFPEAMAAAVASYEAHRVAEANAKRKQGERA
jgi:hypothetical protein